MGHEDHIEVPNDEKSLEEELKNERIRFGSFISAIWMLGIYIVCVIKIQKSRKKSQSESAAEITEL